MSVLGSEGFVVYGGIITGVLAAMIYCRIKHLKFLEYFDLLAPSVALAQGFGRIGCFLAGCCYGRETTAFWGITFPEGSLAPVACVEDEDTCDKMNDCATVLVWKKMNEAINQVVDSITLADLVDYERQRAGEYVI